MSTVIAESMVWNRYEHALGAITGVARLGLPTLSIPGWPPGPQISKAMAQPLAFLERFAVRRETAFSNEATRQAFRKEYAAVLSLAQNVASWDRSGALGVAFVQAVKLIPEVFLQRQRQAPQKHRRRDPRAELEGLVQTLAEALGLDQATTELALAPWRLRDQPDRTEDDENLVMAFEAALLSGEIDFAYGLFRPCPTT